MIQTMTCDMNTEIEKENYTNWKEIANESWSAKGKSLWFSVYIFQYNSNVLFHFIKFSSLEMAFEIYFIHIQLFGRYQPKCLNWMVVTFTTFCFIKTSLHRGQSFHQVWNFVNETLWRVLTKVGSRLESHFSWFDVNISFLQRIFHPLFTVFKFVYFEIIFEYIYYIILNDDFDVVILKNLFYFFFLISISILDFGWYFCFAQRVCPFRCLSVCVLQSQIWCVFHVSASLQTKKKTNKN